jgi:DNA-binding beta-propeller fold protein YncE
VFAAKIPSEVRSYITQNVPGTDIRFDGVIVLPDNTIYLPLYPSLFSDIKEISVKESIPANKDLAQKPDVIIFNNDFVLLKVLSDNSGKKTVLHMTNPPLQVRTGLLPQDMLVPSGLIIPENLKGIIGNLKIDTKKEDIIKLTSKESFEEFLEKNEPMEKQNIIPQLQNKTLFVTTNYSKNIQVVEPPQTSPRYSLGQRSIPIDVEAVNNGKFLLVTSYDRPFLDIISVADSRFIKQISLNSCPEEIIVDQPKNKAYIASPTSSTIFVVDLKNMNLVQKIRINGYCEKLLLTDGKLFYVDKLKSEIWAIELDKGYQLKKIGRFPNVSALAFTDNNLYIASRTKSRIAVVDYSTLGLINEFTTVNKPIQMLIYKNSIFILGAQNNRLQVIDTQIGKLKLTIDLGTDGFSTKLKRIADTQYAVVVDIKTNKYSIIDLEKENIVKSFAMNIPIKDVIIADKVKLFD